MGRACSEIDAVKLRQGRVGGGHQRGGRDADGGGQRAAVIGGQPEHGDFAFAHHQRVADGVLPVDVRLRVRPQTGDADNQRLAHPSAIGDDGCRASGIFTAGNGRLAGTGDFDRHPHLVQLAARLEEIGLRHRAQDGNGAFHAGAAEINLHHLPADSIGGGQAEGQRPQHRKPPVPRARWKASQTFHSQMSAGEKYQSGCPYQSVVAKSTRKPSRTLTPR